MISEEVISDHPLLGRVPREKLRIYPVRSCCIFWVTSREYGEFSNMSEGFPISISGINFKSSEALYQCCKFPDRPDVQEKIIAAPTAKIAKKISRGHGNLVRSDWLAVRSDVMRWTIRVKGVQHKKEFLFPLIQTESMPIVEQSSKDVFWGAVRIDEWMVGVNVLGRLLMELREEIKADLIDLMQLPTPTKIGVKLLGKSVLYVTPVKKR